MFKVYIVDDVLYFERAGVVSGIVDSARAFTRVGLSGVELVIETDGGKRHVISSANEIEVEGVVYDNFDDILSALRGIANFNWSGAENDLSSQHAETITIDDNDTAGTIRVMEQADYDAIVTKVPNRIYYILEPIV